MSRNICSHYGCRSLQADVIFTPKNQQLGKIRSVDGWRLLIAALKKQKMSVKFPWVRENVVQTASLNSSGDNQWSYLTVAGLMGSIHPLMTWRCLRRCGNKGISDGPTNFQTCQLAASTWNKTFGINWCSMNVPPKKSTTWVRFWS